MNLNPWPINVPWWYETQRVKRFSTSLNLQQWECWYCILNWPLEAWDANFGIVIRLAPGRTRRSSASVKDVEAASLMLTQVKRLAGNLCEFTATASAKKKPVNSRTTSLVLARAGRAFNCCYCYCIKTSWNIELVISYKSSYNLLMT